MGKNQKAFKFLCGRISYHTYLNDLREQTAVAEAFLEEVTHLPEFKIVLSETAMARLLVELEWRRNIIRSQEIMADILGFEVVGTYKVYITPPSLKAGHNTGDGILWTNRNDWPNYNTVYLWHEILHSLFGVSDTEHAIIELATDNELRTRLNGGCYPPWEGHKFLNKKRNGLLRRWQKYLKTPNRDILDFRTRALAAK